MAITATAKKVDDRFRVRVSYSDADTEKLLKQDVDSYERLLKHIAQKVIEGEVDSSGTQIDWEYIESETID